MGLAVRPDQHLQLEPVLCLEVGRKAVRTRGDELVAPALPVAFQDAEATAAPFGGDDRHGGTVTRMSTSAAAAATLALIAASPSRRIRTSPFLRHGLPSHSGRPGTCIVCGAGCYGPGLFTDPVLDRLDILTRCQECSGVVDGGAMPDVYDPHHQLAVVDCVDHAVVAYP